jgi:DNA-binding transcriptional LysR family regulator
MHITLDQLVTFERIVRLGTFHAAAHHLGLTQPTVSQRIRELEAQIGATVFLRKGPRISLTAEGHALLGYAERMLATAQEMKNRFQSRNPIEGVLRLGVNETFATVCLSELIRRLEQQNPGLQVSVCVEHSRAMSRLLNDMEVDVAVVSEPQVARHVKEEPVGTNGFAWAASPSMITPRGVVTANEIASLPIMVTAPPTRLYESVMTWFSDAGVKPQRVSMCNNLSFVVRAIVEAIAVGVVPVHVLRRELAAGSVRILPTSCPIERHRVSICYQASEADGPIQALVDGIKDLLREKRLFMPEDVRDSSIAMT